MTNQTNTPKAVKAAKSETADEVELRARAARQAAKQKAALAKTAKQAEAEIARGELVAQSAEQVVKVRVTRRGDGRISTGQHVSGVGEVHFEKGEEFSIALAIAEELAVGPVPTEPRDWVEIL